MSTAKTKAPRKRARLRDYRTQLCVVLILVLGFAAIGLMAFLNRQPYGSHYSYITAEDIWYLSGQEMEIAAPAANVAD